MGPSFWIRPLRYFEMAGGQAGESSQRIIRRLSVDHYHLAGWALCPYLAELEGQDEIARVYFHPGQLLSGFAGGGSLTVDGWRDFYNSAICLAYSSCFAFIS